MSEIKFRAKTNIAIEDLIEIEIEHNDNWVFGTYLDGFIVNGVVEGTPEYIALENWCPIDKNTVGQYTGLKDKNGKEIYEGDILETDLSRPYLVVEFKNGAFMYNCHDDGNDYYDYMGAADENIKQDKFLEVIGNIYDNPELIEED